VVLAASQVPSTRALLVPNAPASVRSARRHIAADLRRHGIPRAIVEDCVLVASEILSNAVKHARPLRSGKLEIAWDVRDDEVEIQVADGGGPTMPQAHAPSLSALGGRGLSIVASLAGTWGVRHDDVGTVVWARLPFPQSARP
jgi:anti-sigma regulatory factor (Ser/Thr protein kinase)